jgi:hypothetical protein
VSTDTPRLRWLGGLVALLLPLAAVACGDDNNGTGPPPPTTGSLEVSAVTAGSDLDADGYTVSVDGGAAQAIGVNGTITVASLSAGDHTVELGGVAANCTVTGSNPRTVTVVAGSTASTTFNVTCSALVGDLEVTTATTGSDPDSAYTVSVDGGAAQAIGANDTLAITGLAAGDHAVLLGDGDPGSQHRDPGGQHEDQADHLSSSDRSFSNMLMALSLSGLISSDLS